MKLEMRPRKARSSLGEPASFAAEPRREGAKPSAPSTLDFCSGSTIERFRERRQFITQRHTQHRQDALQQTHLRTFCRHAVYCNFEILTFFAAPQATVSQHRNFAHKLHETLSHRMTTQNISLRSLITFRNSHNRTIILAGNSRADMSCFQLQHQIQQGQSHQDSRWRAPLPSHQEEGHRSQVR